MLIFETKSEIQRHLNAFNSSENKVGFVPTMGALHLGHISLVQESLNRGLYTVCSIFVNPTQFNDKKDLERYPRTIEKDIELLKKSGCNAVFIPSVKEIYPEEDTRKFDFGVLDTVLEGKHRPGHFIGVAKVVSILFKIVKPAYAFFGSKDYQQVLVIKELTRQLQLPITIIACPIIRENDGLAMSSRNALLSVEERKAAAIIPQLLTKVKSWKEEGKLLAEIKQMVEDTLASNAIYRLEYFEICNRSSLSALTEITKNTEALALIACFVGKIRLIDNLEI